MTNTGITKDLLALIVRLESEMAQVDAEINALSPAFLRAQNTYYRLQKAADRLAKAVDILETPQEETTP